jgi:hypothetical protein
VLPIVLVVLAAGAAAIMAFGTNPDLAQYSHGFQVICLTRRLQWPLVAFSLLCCLALLYLVISNKRRAWWLIALGPITALFAWRFSISPDNFYSVADNPAMLTADTTSFLHEDDWVVGVEFEEQPYAFPFQALYSTPVVIQSDREKRMIVLWSPFANVARVFQIDRETKARELDIVSMPANALLVYNGRIGQFINGVTGLTPRGDKPDGFKAEIPSTKTTWKRWRATHAETKVMVPTGRVAHNPPAAPVLPVYPLPKSLSGDEAQRRIAVVPTTQPIAIPTESIGTKPLNLMAGKTPLLIFRDGTSSELRAFDRRIDEDLMPRFELNHDARRKLAVFTDSDTGCGWSATGVAVDGEKERKGKKLRPVEVEEDLYWGVMKYWYPDLSLVTSH